MNYSIKTRYLLQYSFLCLFFTTCRVQTTSSEQKQSAQSAEDTRICASVQAVSGEYVPLFHTNVFIKSDNQLLADAIETRLIYYHTLFDRNHYYYDTHSEGTIKNLKLINEYAAKSHTITVNQQLIDILQHSLHLMALTDNSFNIFLAPVSDLYTGKFSPFPVQNTDPDARLIQQELQRVLTPEQAATYITCTNENIAFTRPDNQPPFIMDFGGIAKGYAAWQIQKEFSHDTYMVSLGSSTIIANGKNYRIGVASTYYKTLALIQLELCAGMALSTSGTSNNYYILADDGTTIRSHILDPKTGYSHDYYWSVIVIGDNAMVTDALSTALFNIQDKDMLRSIINSVRKAYNCSVEVCFVKDESRNDKTVSLLMTSGFEPFIQKDYKGIGIVSKSLL
ncbi:MAG: FAD:protein FMN transferase [Treponema sp.]|nr:FAD:protein FMN transferase [Treponema sp.]